MASPKKIVIRIPPPLRGYCQDAAEVSVPGDSAKAVLEELERRYPSLYRSVCDETGAVRRHVSLFVNHSLVRSPEELAAAIQPGDIVTIMPAVSGG